MPTADAIVVLSEGREVPPSAGTISERTDGDDSGGASRCVRRASHQCLFRHRRGHLDKQAQSPAHQIAKNSFQRFSADKSRAL